MFSLKEDKLLSPLNSQNVFSFDDRNVFMKAFTNNYLVWEGGKEGFYLLCMITECVEYHAAIKRYYKF